MKKLLVALALWFAAFPLYAQTNAVSLPRSALIGGAVAGNASIDRNNVPWVFSQTGLPFVYPPSGFFQGTTGTLVIGLTPSNSATASFSATSGAGVTMTMSAATLLGTASDVGRILTILDTTFKYATITAQSSTTVATVTLTGTLSGTGPFANSAIWLTGSTSANAVSFPVPLSRVYAGAYMYFPASSAVGAVSGAGWYYTTMASSTQGTVFNNLMPSNLGANGTLLVPAATTAFSGLTAGAYTQTSGSNVFLASGVNIPANSMGVNGELQLSWTSTWDNNTNNAKTIQPVIGGTAVFGGFGSSSTNTNAVNIATMKNAGVANVQYNNLFNVTSAGSASNSGPEPPTAVNTASAMTFQWQFNMANAYDWAAVEGYSLKIAPN